MFSKKQILRSQRGAMFGLDARVALVIFGGLSVLAGAAVFSSARETNITSLLAEFDGISKAYINYTFDTGVDVPPETATNGGFENLYTNTAQVLGAKPPYITRQTNSHPQYGTYSLIRARVSLTNSEVAWAATPTDCNGAADEVCAAWLSLTDIPCELLWELDARIDGGGGNPTLGAPDTGNLRISPADCPVDEGARGTAYYMLSRTSN